VIAIGTPGGIGSTREPPLWLAPGDVVEVTAAQLGALANPVVAQTG
jgi:2-keto-4-pentenoate hydratase/2-oxohepta-3-ene-1,7-dioic acid hydratase in catechol pathway